MTSRTTILATVALALGAFGGRALLTGGSNYRPVRAVPEAPSAAVTAPAFVSRPAGPRPWPETIPRATLAPEVGPADRAAPPAPSMTAEDVVESYQRGLRDERPDPAWAPGAERALADAVSELSGATGLEVACGRTLCRLTWRVEDRARLDEGLDRLPGRLPWPADGFFHVDDARATVMVIVTREGAALPPLA